LRGFLGLTGYYKKFVEGYSQIATPLTALLEKNYFSWTDKAKQTFNNLKLAISNPLVLALPDFSQTFTVECDASSLGLGVVFMQNIRLFVFHS